MISTGAVPVREERSTLRLTSLPSRPAPVFRLTVAERPPPPELLELLRIVDARAADPLPGEKRVEHFRAVADCGRFFLRARCDCGRRILPKSCGDRLCPNCERRRAAQAVKRYARPFDGREYVRHVVLTVKRFRLGELAPSIGLFVKWFRRLRHKYPGAFQGGVYAIETKGKGPHRDDPGGWHTHVHVLVWGCYFDQRELTAAWEKATNGRGRVVWIETAARDSDGSFERALREALKYVTKSPAGKKSGDRDAAAGWTPAMVEEFYAATKHRRLLNKFGDCPKVPQLEPLLCRKCGLPVTVCHGHYERALTLEEAEAWASEPEPEPFREMSGETLDRFTAHCAAAREALATVNGGPGP